VFAPASRHALGTVLVLFLLGVASRAEDARPASKLPGQRQPGQALERIGQIIRRVGLLARGAAVRPGGRPAASPNAESEIRRNPNSVIEASKRPEARLALGFRLQVYFGC
jgi:hypothetical protein